MTVKTAVLLPAFLVLYWVSTVYGEAHPSGASTTHPSQTPCYDLAETVPECYRRSRDVVISETGFPGLKNYQYDLAAMTKPLHFESFFNPAVSISPYGTGGMIRPGHFRLEGLPGNRIISESWRPVTSLDTPSTVIHWVRGAFNMNLFHLKFQRMLTENTYLSLGLASSKADSQEFDYAFQVHQIPLGLSRLKKAFPFLERDSASLVILGVTPGIDAFSFRPRVGLRLDSQSVLEFFWDKHTNRSDFISPLDSQRVLFYTETLQHPVPGRFASSSMGVSFFRKMKLGEIRAHFAHSLFDRELFFPASVIFPDSNAIESPEDYFEGSIQRLNLAWQSANLPLRPEIRLNAFNLFLNGPVFREVPEIAAPKAMHPGEAWEDTESAALILNPRVGRLSLRLKGGLQRQSLLSDERKVLGFYAAETDIQLPWQGEVHGGYGFSQRQPDWQERHVLNPVLRRFPSPGLRHESLKNIEIGYGQVFRAFHIGTFLEFNTGKNAILNSRLPLQDTSLVPDAEALPLTNYDREKRYVWRLLIGVNWKNFVLNMERAWLMFSKVYGGGTNSLARPQEGNPGLPSVITKGHLGWGRRFVHDRLGVKLDWDWEWYGRRLDWAPNLEGMSRPVKLDEYLILDFKAQMQIRQFILYYQMKNLNHDRYYPEPGVHPPGINFRWGIRWQLDG